MTTRSIRSVLLSASILAAAPALAADVTPERLANPDKEPQNWLMNHRTYDGQRFSPLARINRDNVKNLKLAYAVPLGGGAGNEFANATPLAEDGFLYVTRRCVLPSKPPIAITRRFTATARADSLSYLKDGVRRGRMGVITGHPAFQRAAASPLGAIC